MLVKVGSYSINGIFKLFFSCFFKLSNIFALINIFDIFG